MLQSADDALRFMEEGEPILGRGWKEVDAFDDLDDLDEYESDEEEVYVVVDLGNGIDNKSLLAENSYQLIGLDTPLPFLKIGNQVFQGEKVNMIGDEIIFGRIRNEENPQEPNRPPYYATSLRLQFRPIILRDKPQEEEGTTTTPPSPQEFFLPFKSSGGPSRAPKMPTQPKEPKELQQPKQPKQPNPSTDPTSKGPSLVGRPKKTVKTPTPAPKSPVRPPSPGRFIYHRAPVPTRENKTRKPIPSIMNLGFGGFGSASTSSSSTTPPTAISSTMAGSGSSLPGYNAYSTDLESLLTNNGVPIKQLSMSNTQNIGSGDTTGTALGSSVLGINQGLANTTLGSFDQAGPSTSSAPLHPLSSSTDTATGQAGWTGDRASVSAGNGTGIEPSAIRETDGSVRESNTTQAADEDVDMA